MRSLRFLPIFLSLLAAATARAATANGDAASPANLDPLVVERTLDAPPAEVWAAFATAEGFRKLGVAKAAVDLRIGGRIRTHYDPQGTLGDEGTIESEILAHEPGRMLAFRIARPPKGFPFPESAWETTWTILTLADLGGRTHLRLAMLGWTADPPSQAMRAFFTKRRPTSARPMTSLPAASASRPSPVRDCGSGAAGPRTRRRSSTSEKPVLPPRSVCSATTSST